jgi:hypothetical protein
MFSGLEVPSSEGFEPPPNRHLSKNAGAGKKTMLIPQPIVKSLGYMSVLPQNKIEPKGVVASKLIEP